MEYRQHTLFEDTIFELTWAAIDTSNIKYDILTIIENE